MSNLRHPAKQFRESVSTKSRMRLFGLVALCAAMAGLCVLISTPFLPAITWSIALAIIAWPMHRWLERRLGRPKIAAALSTFVVVGVIAACGSFVVYHLARETHGAAADLQAKSATGGIRETLGELPVVNRAVDWMERVGVDVETEASKLAVDSARGFVGWAQGSVAGAVQVLVTVFALYYLFLDRDELIASARDLLPLSGAEADRVFADAADSVHANLYATVTTSAIDTVTGGIMFWMLGLPAPALWAAVMFVLALMPVVGAALVWLPAVAYLALSGNVLGAAALLAWGLTSFAVVDNYLYVRLAGGRMRMHPIPAMIGFLGGIAVFGISGMILGPAIFAVAGAFVDVWKRRIEDNGSPAIPATNGQVKAHAAATSGRT